MIVPANEYTVTMHFPPLFSIFFYFVLSENAMEIFDICINSK